MGISEVQAYLSLVYHRVEKMFNGFYALYDKDDSYMYNVADENGVIITDFKVSEFETEGPFVIFRTIKDVDSIAEINDYNTYKTLKNVGYYKLAIKKTDIYSLGITGAIRARRVYGVNRIRPSTVQCHDGSYRFYILTSNTGESAVFNDSGEQLSPFIYAIRERVRHFGRYIIFTVKTTLNYTGDNSKDWFDIKYDKTLGRIVDFGTFKLEEGRYKTVVELISLTENFQKNSIIPEFGFIGKRKTFKPIWQITDNSGNPLSCLYSEIDKVGFKFYDQNVYRVRSYGQDNRCFGYITKDGFELVPPAKFLIAEPVGNSEQFTVVEQLSNKENTYSQKHGIWDGKNQQMIQELDLNKRYLWKNIGKHGELNILISLKTTQGKTLYSIVGNDGKDYDNFQDAFELYSDGRGIYAVIIYGVKYYFKAKTLRELEVINTPVIESEHKWFKV